MLRVLHVYPQLRNAGTEMVIMNLYRNIDRSKVQFDFLIQRSGELDETIRGMGGIIHLVEKTKSYSKDLLMFFKSHPEYKIVHTHTDADMGTVLKMAKKAGVPTRIAHSHNYRGDVPRFMKYYKVISGWDIEQNATHFRACSQEAAEWLFPRKYREAEVWNNAINLEAFLFDASVRREYRKLLDIPQNARVVCHVGRFAEQKNHERIIKLLNRMTKDSDDVYGVLVGVGPLEEKIKAESTSERIFFLGNRTDVPKIMCAADVFLFPSLYEGLGIVAVEAQASGMMCVASQNVPKAADIGIGAFEQLELSADDYMWIEALEKACAGNTDEVRTKRSNAAFGTEYNIHSVAAKVQDFYLSMR